MRYASIRTSIERYLGSVVPDGDNFFAALNSAVFSDGSFVYVPPGVRCPMELSTYFRINAAKTGQFERTLIIAAEGARELPGGLHRSDARRESTACRRRGTGRAGRCTDQVLDGAESGPGDENGLGGIYNFVTKRGECRGRNSKDLLDPGGDRLRDHLEISELRLAKARTPIGEFYSVAVANNYQQADTGTKMIHIGTKHQEHHRFQGIWQGMPRTPIAAWSKSCRAPRRAQLHAVPFAADGREMRGAHLSVHGGEEPHGDRRARGEHLEIGEDQLFYCLSAAFPPRMRSIDCQRLLQGRVQGASDGIRSGSRKSI